MMQDQLYNDYRLKLQRTNRLLFDPFQLLKYTDNIIQPSREHNVTIAYRLGGLGGLTGLCSNSFSTAGGLSGEKCDDFKTPANNEPL